MIRRRILALVAGLMAAALQAPAQPAARHEFKKPKLVLGIVIDQFRYDYLTRFRKDYTGAFARFNKSAAIFTNAHYEHYPTVTAIGHSSFMSGATPSASGIVGNSWFDRTSGKNVTSVSDDATQLLGGAGKGSSPRRLLTSTIGDELKMAGRNSKVVGVSIKDRSAILPAGHIADGAYWFDGGSGNFVSSTYYFADLPAWVKEFNGKRPADQYANAEWKAIDSDKVFKKMPPAADSKLYNSLESTPWGNDLIEAFAERALEAEQLGKHAGTDLLAVSFSANDYVGHAVGPDDPQVRDISIRTDRLIEKLLKVVDASVGLDNVLVVLTADHGVAPVPEVNRDRKMPAGRLSDADLAAPVQAALTARFGEGKWISGSGESSLYFNRDFLKQKNLSEAEVERTAADALRDAGRYFRVYGRDEMIHGQLLQDRYSQRLRNGFYPSRSGDVVVVPEPYWMFSARGTTHGNLFSFDTHVPVIFMGPNIVPGRYDGAIAPNDIAPTLAAILEIETPSGALGRVLSEMLVK